jgi:hypothetical protein
MSHGLRESIGLVNCAGRKTAALAATLQLLAGHLCHLQVLRRTPPLGRTHATNLCCSPCTPNGLGPDPHLMV